MAWFWIWEGGRSPLCLEAVDITGVIEKYVKENPEVQGVFVADNIAVKRYSKDWGPV